MNAPLLKPTTATSQVVRIERQLSRLVRFEPFFACLALRLTVSESPAVETFSSDGVDLRVNPEYCASLSDAQITSVLCEQVLHMGLGHIWRAPAAADWRVWNRACDQEARAILEEAGAETFPAAPGAEPVEARFKGLAVEAIYRTLLAEVPPPAEDSGDGDGESGEAGAGAGNQSAQSAQADPVAGDQPGDGQPSPGEMEQPSQDGQAEAEQLRQEWAQAAQQAAELAKGRGHVPASLVRLVRELTRPRVDWRAVLRDFLRERAQDDWSWCRPNTRYADAEFILPALHSERAGRIVFAVDTSGSIGEHLLAAFRAEQQWCLDELQPEALVDICCDAVVQQVREYCPGDAIERQATGGGGTDFRPVFGLLAEKAVPPVCLVYLTDLDGEFPAEEPGYPVLWVTTSDRRAPFGRTVKIEEAA